MFYLILVTLMFVLIINIVEAVGITGCQALAGDTVYTLSANFTSDADPCFTINGNNILFEGNRSNDVLIHGRSGDVIFSTTSARTNITINGTWINFTSGTDDEVIYLSSSSNKEIYITDNLIYSPTSSTSYIEAIEIAGKNVSVLKNNITFGARYGAILVTGSYANSTTKYNWINLTGASSQSRGIYYGYATQGNISHNTIYAENQAGFLGSGDLIYVSGGDLEAQSGNIINNTMYRNDGGCIKTGAEGSWNFTDNKCYACRNSQTGETGRCSDEATIPEYLTGIEVASNGYPHYIANNYIETWDYYGALNAITIYSSKNTIYNNTMVVKSKASAQYDGCYYISAYGNNFTDNNCTCLENAGLCYELLNYASGNIFTREKCYSNYSFWTAYTNPTGFLLYHALDNYCYDCYFENINTVSPDKYYNLALLWDDSNTFYFINATDSGKGESAIENVTCCNSAGSSCDIAYGTYRDNEVMRGYRVGINVTDSNYDMGVANANVFIWDNNHSEAQWGAITDSEGLVTDEVVYNQIYDCSQYKSYNISINTKISHAAGTYDSETWYNYNGLYSFPITFNFEPNYRISCSSCDINNNCGISVDLHQIDGQPILGANNNISIFDENWNMINTSIMDEQGLGIYTKDFNMSYGEGLYYAAVDINSVANANLICSFFVGGAGGAGGLTAEEQSCLFTGKYINGSTCEVGETGGELKMIAIIFGSIIFMFAFGYLGFKFEGLLPKIFGYGVSLIQLVFLMGLIYANEKGTSLLQLVKINFYITLILVFGIGATTIVIAAIKIMNINDEMPEEDIKWLDDKGSKWKK